MDIAARLKEKWLKWFKDHDRTKQAIEAYANPVDDPNNSEFMHEACSYWAGLGNNGEDLSPEDCDVDEVPFEVAGNPSESECAGERE
jgi:hypothetical protein